MSFKVEQVVRIFKEFLKCNHPKCQFELFKSKLTECFLQYHVCNFRTSAVSIVPGGSLCVCRGGRRGFDGGGVEKGC